jgi:hypothetical protein
MSLAQAAKPFNRAAPEARGDWYNDAAKRDEGGMRAA